MAISNPGIQPNHGDIFSMLVPDSGASTVEVDDKNEKTSPTSQSYNQHILSPTSATKIDVIEITRFVHHG